MRRKLLALTLILTLTLSSSSVVSATQNSTALQTVNEIYAKYDKALAKEYERILSEYYDTRDKYDNMKEQIAIDESYNALFEEALVYQNAKKQEIQEEVNGLLKENESISNEINNGIDGDWNELKRLDAQYKVNSVKANSLLQEKNVYALTSARDIDYITFDDLEQKITTLSEKYKDLEGSGVVGVVDGLKYPLDCGTYVTSGYGDRVDPITGTNVRFHGGIDLYAPIGTNVLSVFNGTVKDAGYSVLCGNYIMIDHCDGLVSYYCHLESIDCNIGDFVQQYEVIGKSGNTGARTTGPHLHFGMYIKGNPVDPTVLFE